MSGFAEFSLLLNLNYPHPLPLLYNHQHLLETIRFLFAIGIPFCKISKKKAKNMNEIFRIYGCESTVLSVIFQNGTQLASRLVLPYPLFLPAPFGWITCHIFCILCCPAFLHSACSQGLPFQFPPPRWPSPLHSHRIIWTD